MAHHLLLLTEAFAHHLIHGRFHETRCDHLPVAIPFAVIRNEVSIVPDVRAERFNGLEQLRELRIRLCKVIQERCDVIDLLACLVGVCASRRRIILVGIIGWLLLDSGGVELTASYNAIFAPLVLLEAIISQ